MSDWQLIETAPRDGREILVCWRRGWKVWVGLMWKTNDRITYAHARGGLGNCLESYWGDPDEYDDYELALPENQPTHWLPVTLPAEAGVAKPIGEMESFP